MLITQKVGQSRISSFVRDEPKRAKSGAFFCLATGRFSAFCTTLLSEADSFMQKNICRFFDKCQDDQPIFSVTKGTKTPK